MRTQFYLFDPKGEDRLLGRANLPQLLRSLEKTWLVIPRALCIHEQIDCVSLPVWKIWLWRRVAQLQAKLRSPFAKTGFCALRQGKTLHLWIWDASHEVAFAQRHPEAVVERVLASAVFAPPQVHGVNVQDDGAGLGWQACLWSQGALLDTVAVPQTLVQTWDAQAWRQQVSERNEQLNLKPELAWPLNWRPTHSVAPGFQLALSPVAKIWPGLILPTAEQFQWRVMLPKWRRWGLIASSLGVAAFLGAVFAQHHGLEKKLEQVKSQRDQKIQSLENATQQQKSAQNILDWLDRVASLQPKLTMGQYVQQLSERLQRIDMAVRELELSGTTASATLVPIGPNFKITRVIDALESEPLFYDARFVDVVGGDAFKFTWRLRDSPEQALGGAKKGKQP
jgi:hypothetical protein